MQYKIEELNDITDSIEIIRSTPNGFSKYMFYIISLLLIFITIWSIFAPKYIVITSPGEIRPKDNICDIYSETSGTVISTNIKDGQFVKKEDTLLTVNNGTVIKAQCDGVVSLSHDINMGDFIQSGKEIAKILPYDQLKKKVNLYINSQDISNIKEGTDVNLEILSIPETEYLPIKTTIKNISTDAKTSNDYSYYTVTCDLDTTKVNDKKGNHLNVKDGMKVKARIINGQVPYFRYFLEKINILN